MPPEAPSAEFVAVTVRPVAAPRRLYCARYYTAATISTSQPTGAPIRCRTVCRASDKRLSVSSGTHLARAIANAFSPEPALGGEVWHRGYRQIAQFGGGSLPRVMGVVA